MKEIIFLNINIGVNDIKPNQNEGLREKNKKAKFSYVFDRSSCCLLFWKSWINAGEAF